MATFVYVQQVIQERIGKQVRSLDGLGGGTWGGGGTFGWGGYQNGERKVLLNCMALFFISVYNGLQSSEF